MKTLKLLALMLMMWVTSTSQIVSSNLFLQGKYLEIGAQQNGSLGTGVSAPTGYHPRNSSTPTVCSYSSARLLAAVYDHDRDGWTVGTPNYMGDYTLPGSPWEGWGIEVNGTREYAYSTLCNLSGGLGVAIGGWTSYTNIGGRAIGNWYGTMLSGNLRVFKEYRLDTFANAMIVTVKLVNVGSTTLYNVYYLRSFDPDNSVPWGGSYSTVNTIRYQNDYLHRVMVSATATGSSSSTGTPAAAIALGTKDTRAKAIIYSYWPLSTTVTYASLYSGTSTGAGTITSAVNASVTADIAIGLVYNLCSIAPGDSTVLSYGFIFNGATDGYQSAIDTAFPEPRLSISGRIIDSADTVTACSGATDSSILRILNGDDKSWSWADWTWSPSIGLATSTGVTNTLHLNSISSVMTYTITGKDTTHCRDLHKVFYLTAIPAHVDSPSVRDTAYCQMSTPGSIDASISHTGTLRYYDSDTATIAYSTPPIINTSTAGTYTYYVTQTVHGCESNKAILQVTINPMYVSNFDTSICQGDSYIFYGTRYNVSGRYLHTFTTINGCDSLKYLNLTVNPTYDIHFYDTICSDSIFYFAGIRRSVTGIYTNTYTTINGCDSVVSCHLYVHESPKIELEVDPYHCIGDTVIAKLQGVRGDITNYLWTHPGGNYVAGSQYEMIYKYDVAGIYSISCTAFTPFCASRITADSIYIGNYPIAHIESVTKLDSYMPTEFCIGDSVSLMAATSTDAFYYKWSPYNIISDINLKDGIGTLIHSGYVTLTISSIYGCKDTDSVYIDVHACCLVQMPNAFTPNDDGKNDRFRPLYSHINIHEFKIYNRWGNCVYIATGNLMKGWDGTYEGVKCDIGTYMYVLEYDCDGETKLISGDVTLIR